MLTAYLFWRQVINIKIDFNKFFLKRIYRLVPIVLLVVTVVTIFGFIFSEDNSLNISRVIALLKKYMFGLLVSMMYFLQICI